MAAFPNPGVVPLVLTDAIVPLPHLGLLGEGGVLKVMALAPLTLSAQLLPTTAFPWGLKKNEVFPFKVYNAKVKNLQCSRDKAVKTASELLSSLNHSVSNLPIAVVSKMNSNL